MITAPCLREPKITSTFCFIFSTRQVHTYLLCQHHVEWKFCPERAPYFGGLWKAAGNQPSFTERVAVTQEYLSEHVSTFLAEKGQLIISKGCKRSTSGVGLSPTSNLATLSSSRKMLPSRAIGPWHASSRCIQEKTEKFVSPS